MRSRTQGSKFQPLDERLEESDWPHRREQVARWVAIGDTSLLQDLTPEQRAEVLTQVAAIRRDHLLRHIARAIAADMWNRDAAHPQPTSTETS